MLFHSPLASSSCPFMVKWKQSWVKKVMSIFPFCPRGQVSSVTYGFDQGWATLMVARAIIIMNTLWTHLKSESSCIFAKNDSALQFKMAKNSRCTSSKCVTFWACRSAIFARFVRQNVALWSECGKQWPSPSWKLPIPVIGDPHYVKWSVPEGHQNSHPFSHSALFFRKPRQPF